MACNAARFAVVGALLYATNAANTNLLHGYHREYVAGIIVVNCGGTQQGFRLHPDDTVLVALMADPPGVADNCTVDDVPPTT